MNILRSTFVILFVPFLILMFGYHMIIFKIVVGAMVYIWFASAMGRWVKRNSE